MVGSRVAFVVVPMAVAVGLVYANGLGKRHVVANGYERAHAVDDADAVALAI